MGLAIKYVAVLLFCAICSAAYCTDESEPTKRELLRRQAEIWSQLDQDTRRVLAQRSEYVYKFSDQLVIDAYDLLYWQERLDALLVRKTVQKYNNHNGYRTKEITGYEWEYRSDDETDEYFRIPTYGALYWHDGVLINEESRWNSSSYSAFIKQAGVDTVVSKSDKEIVKTWIKTNLPLLVVVDPMAQSDSDFDLYKNRSDGVYLMRGAIGSALGVQLELPTPMDGKITMFPGDLSESHRGSPTKMPDLVGRGLRNGAPGNQYDSYLLVPDSASSNGAAIGPSAGGRQWTEFEIADLRQFSIKPKELAVLWMEKKLEIPYRVLERNGSGWGSSEYLLQRP